MGGYHRLMVHRLAEYYCMEHEVEEGQWGADQSMDVSLLPAAPWLRCAQRARADIFSLGTGYV
jgi:hypothetical protein